MAFYDIGVMEIILSMYSFGIAIRDISDYVGMVEDEVNEVVDAYNQCLLY